VEPDEGGEVLLSLGQVEVELQSFLRIVVGMMLACVGDVLPDLNLAGGCSSDREK